ncbi:MAG: STAS domain-containing protein [Planctomycetaceae bacterium]
MSDRIHTETTPDGVTVVALGAEYENLNEPLLEDLEAFLLETADRISPPLLLLDLSHTRFFGSAFLEALFRVWSRLKKRGDGRFALCGLTEYCAEVIETTHLERLWTVAANRDDAVKALLSRE